jgi:ABC-2 type transport system ATP-binding protein
MIEATGLTKRYGEKVAVHDLSFTIRPCIVTGFLGSNGSGKPTTMRMIVGLDAPSRVATVNGRGYAQLEAPLQEVGAAGGPRGAYEPSARNHLRAMAATTGISRGRVEEVIDLAASADASQTSRQPRPARRILPAPG